ncbi:MAG: D-alanine--D-alanine ligase [Bdellovibrionales bacterium]|nr:D-alanine--D-alanine ligase [Bdellovibrionales bacterium]
MKRVALVFGGPSAEHDVSVVSAKNIYSALKDSDLQILLLAITKNKVWRRITGEDLMQTSFQSPISVEEMGIKIELCKEGAHVFAKAIEGEEKSGPIDVVFPICHGPFGEDGELQAELEEWGLSYVGSSQESCQLSFDKALTKQAIVFTGIPQAPYLAFEEKNPQFEEVKNQLGLPFFIKPARMGSSVGIHKVKSKEEFHEALADARIHDRKIIIEKAIVGRELECAILETDEGPKASGIGEVRPLHEFYSYEAKYLDPNGAELIIPAQVEPQIATHIQRLAVRAFQQLKCRDFARVDFFLANDGAIYFNELNTHPGFTNISQFPLLWQQEGLGYKELILALLNQADKRAYSNL